MYLATQSHAHTFSPPPRKGERVDGCAQPCTYGCTGRANGRFSLTSSIYSAAGVGVTCHVRFLAARAYGVALSGARAWLCEAVLSALARIET